MATERKEQIAQTAAEAYARYQAALASHSLVQGQWQTKADDGRQLACALGVIGNIHSAGECPAQIMPRWLAQMTVWLFDGQKADDAFAWGERFYAEIARLNGAVPFSVIHDWQANIVGPLAIEVAEKRKRNVEAHKALQAMQAAALAGKKFTADEWRPVLKAAFIDAYAYADANADAYANADADANAYADANANAYAYAYADANADAYADADAKSAAVKRLADGMVECLARVPTSE